MFVLVRPRSALFASAGVSLQEGVGSSDRVEYRLAFETAVTGSPFVATESACDKGKAR